MSGKGRSHGSDNKAKNAVKSPARKAKSSGQSPLNSKKSEESVENTPEEQYQSLVTDPCDGSCATGIKVFYGK